MIRVVTGQGPTNLGIGNPVGAPPYREEEVRNNRGRNWDGKLGKNVVPFPYTLLIFSHLF